MKKGDAVRDNDGEFGRGVVTRVWPYGADIVWDRGGYGFLGFQWLDRVASAADRAAHPTVEQIIDIPDFPS